MAIIKEFQGEYRWLSNFATVDILHDEILYPSVEHAWVASKNTDVNWKRKCAASIHPSLVKKMGDDVDLREDWDEVKETIMKELLILKFNQEPFRTKLIETGNDYIMEGNWWGDKFWGYCLQKNEGRNLLGGMIMGIRLELIKSRVD